MPFPAGRCLFIASGHGSGRPWNTAAVRLFDGKDMPRKRLEGRSLKGRGTGVHSQRRRAGAEKPPVPYQTGRETLAAGGRLALTPGERGVTGIPVHKSGA